MTPPRLVQGPQEVVQVRRHMAASAPRTNTSSRPLALEVAAGADLGPPGGDPIETHAGDHVLPFR